MQGTQVQSPAREGPACLAALKAAPGEPVCGSKRVAPTQPACSKEKPAQSKVRIKCSLNNNFMEIKFQRINCMRLKHKTSLVAQTEKHLPTMRETQVRSLGQEDPLEKEMATSSTIPAWKIPWREETDGLQFMRSQRVGHNRVTSLSLSLFKA